MVLQFSEGKNLQAHAHKRNGTRFQEATQRKLDSSFSMTLPSFSVSSKRSDLHLIKRNLVIEENRLGGFDTRLSGDFIFDVAIRSTTVTKGPYEQ